MAYDPRDSRNFRDPTIPPVDPLSNTPSDVVQSSLPPEVVQTEVPVVSPRADEPEDVTPQQATKRTGLVLGAAAVLLAVVGFFYYANHTPSDVPRAPQGTAATGSISSGSK